MTTVFKHSGALGDIIYSLPTIEALGGGVLWMPNPRQYEFGKLLFAAQPCVTGVRCTRYRAEVVDLDAYRALEWDLRRSGRPTHLADCFAKLLNVEPDLSRPWLVVPEAKRAAPIVVSRSLKYHDREEVDWRLLRGRPHVFVGLPQEWLLFDKVYQTGGSYHECRSLLDMAEVIAGGSLFVGNQSVGFAIAEGLKVNRVLEVCHQIPNCTPKTDNGRTTLTEEFIEECLTGSYTGGRAAGSATTCS